MGLELALTAATKLSKIMQSNLNHRINQVRSNQKLATAVQPDQLVETEPRLNQIEKTKSNKIQIKRKESLTELH